MRIGILGGGQLARMMAQAGKPLGMEFMFFCPDTHACAAPFGEHLCANFDDEQAQQRLADHSDVITYEFENVPLTTVDALDKGNELHPSPSCLAVAKDRLLEKKRFTSLGIPTADFAAVDSLTDLEAGVGQTGFPAILKTRTQGYDGKGQAVLRGMDDLTAAWEQVGKVPCIVESMIGFEREVSIIAVRDRKGEVAFYPLSENHHREGILRLSLARPADPTQSQAESLIRRLLVDMDYVGVLALELFQVGDWLGANEMAPRVHNTGHWTIEGARTSQFENHLRAISGMALGVTTLRQPAAMVNLIGTLPAEEAIRNIPGATPHFYGKSNRPGRKVGHVTLTCEGSTSEVFHEHLARLLKLAGETELASQINLNATSPFCGQEQNSR